MRLSWFKKQKKGNFLFNWSLQSIGTAISGSVNRTCTALAPAGYSSSYRAVPRYELSVYGAGGGTINGLQVRWCYRTCAPLRITSQRLIVDFSFSDSCKWMTHLHGRSLRTTAPNSSDDRSWWGEESLNFLMIGPQCLHHQEELWVIISMLHACNPCKTDHKMLKTSCSCIRIANSFPFLQSLSFQTASYGH